jgi:hypothetical protein
MRRIKMSCQKRDEERDELLSRVPKEFRSQLSYMAYERGHSAGEDEVILHLGSLIDDLEEPIREFEKRIRQEKS